MKKIALMIGGAAVTAGVDVTGETYGQAVAILKNQGYKAVFAGSVGDDLPQSQCIVIAQNSSGRN